MTLAKRKVPRLRSGYKFGVGVGGNAESKASDRSVGPFGFAQGRLRTGAGEVVMASVMAQANSRSLDCA